MNNHGYRQDLQWKLDIQHYNATIEHVSGVLNTPAEVFSRLVEKAHDTMSHIMVLKCSEEQCGLIMKFYEWLFAHSGVDRTIALLTQHCPEESFGGNWTSLRNDVREYFMCGATCQNGHSTQSDSGLAIRSLETKAHAAHSAGHD